MNLLYTEYQSSLDEIQDHSGLFAQFTAGDIGGCSSTSITGHLSRESNMQQVPQSLVLDTEKVELVKASGRRVVVGKKGDKTETKSVAALKSHSEAERRRRERINSHLTALRALVPSNEKVGAFFLKNILLHPQPLQCGSLLTSLPHQYITSKLIYI